MSRGWPGMLKTRSGMGVVSNIFHLICLFRGYIATSIVVPETFKLKNFETWVPATYNNGLVVKY